MEPGRFPNELPSRSAFDERFRTAGRSIRSSSHNRRSISCDRQHDESRAALKRVGQAMNAEEDILSCSSPRTATGAPPLGSQPPLELASLTPTALARMLQDSGSNGA